MAGSRVELYVYDLSNGMARSFGPALGIAIEGIWHTSLVVHGQEVYFGQGISYAQPGRTHHGEPMKKITLGNTTRSSNELHSLVDSLRPRYRAQDYHLLEHNCNFFTNELSQLLGTAPIPTDILNQPRDLMATPFGSSMRPMIENMFRDDGPGPSAQESVDNITQSALSGSHLPPIPSHPHDALRTPVLSQLSRSLAPLSYASLPPLESLMKKIKSIFADAKMTNDSSRLIEAESIILERVLPFLYTPDNATTNEAAPMPEGLRQKWYSSTLTALEFLPTDDIFVVLDLWRIGLAKHAAQLVSIISLGIAKRPSLLSTFLQLFTSLSASSKAVPRALSLTLVKLFSNALVSPLLANALLAPPLREPLTRLIIQTLLSEDSVVRTNAAGLAWGVVSFEYKLLHFSTADPTTATSGTNGKGRDEEWEMEITSAVLEALSVEKESVDVIHRLGATLGLLLFKSPNYDALNSLLEVLEAKKTLEKARGVVDKAKGKREVAEVLREVELLLSAA